MIQLKLTDAQFQDLYMALGAAEHACKCSAVDSEVLECDALKTGFLAEAHRYKELRHFITETKEVI